MIRMKKGSGFIDLTGLGEATLSGVRPIIGILLGLLAGAGLIALSGVNPLEAYAAMYNGAFGSPQAFTNVLVRASPLLLAGAGVAIGIKAGVFNLGAEGYMYAGAIGATLVGLLPLSVPPLVHIILSILAAVAFSAIWGFIPAYLRAYRGLNEVVTTIMLNYVAISFTSWLVHPPGFLAEADSFFPMSPMISSSVRLPILMRGTSLHPGFIVGITVCILLYFAIHFTPFGFRTRMLGINPEAARYAGVNVKRQLLLVMVIGAVMGGLAGAFEVLGLKSRLYMDFVAGVGYEGVAVALLAAGNPLGVIFSALFFSALKAGGTTMSIQTGVGAPMTVVIEALSVIFVIAIGYGKRKRKRLKRREETSKDVEGENDEQ